MMNQPPPQVLKVASRHIVRALREHPDFATMLPGNVWRGVAPSNTPYPHIVYAYMSGDDKATLGGGWSLSNLRFLLKVIDHAISASRAMEVSQWMEEALYLQNGADLGGGYVYLDREAPFSLPLVENDQLFQQEGGTYRVFVDETGE